MVMIKAPNYFPFVLINPKNDKYSLAKRHQALLNDVPLSLSKGSATGQTIDGVEHRVNHDGAVVRASEQWGTLGE